MSPPGARGPLRAAAGSDRTARRFAAGLTIALAYVALAWLSGWLSPLARRPILDGLAPVAPYRWVSPPPELAASNQPPASGTFEVPLRPSGSEPAVFITPDNQVTLVIDRNAFPARGEDRVVRLSVTPLDPATLSSLPNRLSAFGNALELRATYEPSGRPVRHMRQPIDVFAVYPVTLELHATTHELLRSDEGATWTSLGSQDSAGLQQVTASVSEFGLLVVAGRLVPNPVVPAPPQRDIDPVAIALLAGSAVALIVGLVLVLRGRNAQ